MLAPVLAQLVSYTDFFFFSINELHIKNKVKGKVMFQLNIDADFLCEISLSRLPDIKLYQFKVWKRVLWYDF